MTSTEAVFAAPPLSHSAKAVVAVNRATIWCRAGHWGAGKAGPALVATRSVQLCGRVLCKDLCGIIDSLLFPTRRCSEGVSCATRPTIPAALGGTARGLRTGGRARHSCFHLLYLPTDGAPRARKKPGQRRRPAPGW